MHGAAQAEIMLAHQSDRGKVMNNQHEYAPCGKECEYCGADWEPIYGDGTLASPYECGECYSLSAEYQWRGEGRDAGYYDHLERRIADVGAIKSSRA